jgi:hypothetical protein
MRKTRFIRFTNMHARGGMTSSPGVDLFVYVGPFYLHLFE